MSEYGPTGGLQSGHEMGVMTPIKVAQTEFQPPKPLDGDGFDFLLKLTKRLEKEDEVTDRLFHQKWLKNAKFYEGEHLGRFDARGQWRSYTPQLGDPYYLHPLLRFHSDAITASWTQSRPDIRVLPANDLDETVSAARRAQSIVDHYEETLLTEEFLQREGKLGQFTGQMYRFTWWDSNAGPIVPRFGFSQQEVPLSEGGYSCPQCGNTGPLDELFSSGGSCQICGLSQDQLQVDGPQTLIVPRPEELGKFHIGDICTESVPAFQVKMDRSTGLFSTTAWLRRRRMIRPEIVREMFPFWEPPTRQTAAAAVDDFPLRAERILQQSTGIPGRAWRPDTLQNPYAAVVVNQWWVMPCMYAARPAEPSDLEFAGGMRIPKGEKLINVFPRGIYLLVVDQKILDVREECLHNHWQHSPFILIPTRVEGDGIEDMIEPSREYDDLMSLIYVDAKSNAAPPTIVNTAYGLKTTDISGKPHWVVPARVPPGENLSNAILQLPGRGAQYSLFKFLELLQGEHQLFAKSFSPATGAPEVVTAGKGAQTATGSQLATSAAQAQRGPELAIRAAGSVTWAKQVLYLFQKNAVDAHYVPKQGRYGAVEGKSFKGSDIEGDFIFTIRNRSYIPRDEFSRRNDLLGAIQAGVLNPQLPRVVRDEIAEEFNVPLTITGDMIADTRLAKLRLDQMTQLLQQLMQVAQPEVIPFLLLQAVPIEPISDGHQVMSEWYIDWLKTDEGIMAPPPLRQAIILRVQEHEQAYAKRMQTQQLLQMTAMAPQIAMQQEQQNNQQQHEIAMQGAQHASAMAQARAKQASPASSKKS